MNNRTKHELARLAKSPADYARFKLAGRHVEQWEDGLHLDTGAPNIEWWYSDCTLDDGSQLAVIHCTKDASRANQPLEPLIEIDLDLPDGRRMMKYGYFKPEEFEASKDRCDVRIGQYRFTGDLHEYHITGAAEDLSAEIHIESLTEPWRPATGNIVFGPEGHDIFGWTPAVPFGKATVTYRIGTEVHQATGTGYHDHNWCTKEMGQMLDHWWWAKGQVGPYMFISAHIVTAKKYGYSPVHFFMLSRDGKVVADDDEKVSFTTSGSQIDEHTGKPVPDAICFDYLDGDTRYTMSYLRQKTMVSQKILDFAKGWQKAVGEMIRYPGGYLRFQALVTLECYKGGQVVEHYELEGVFEQMYFGQKIDFEQ